MKNRILIAEEHKLLRQGLRALISTLPDFEVIGECQDGKEAVRLSTTLSPAVLLMDLSVPGLNGIEATAQIKRRQPEIKVVALTSHNTGEYVREALRAGADGYILKDASYDELVMALRSVASGKKFLSPDLSGHQPKKCDSSDHQNTVTAPWAKLTARERSILKLIAEGRTNRATAEFLQVSPKTVEKHRANLMRKLGLRNVSELTRIALECGLIENPSTAARPPSKEEVDARWDTPPAGL
jgi:DNA-binding NarL/FixJ family response regulator